MTARHFDAIVIGAGITGAAVASFLSETGLKVLILERYKPVFGASGGNLGQISISDRTESWHMPLAVESQDYYHNLQSKSYDIEYVRSGGSVVLKGDEQLGLAAKAKEKMKGFGVAAELVKNRADILRIEPHIDPDTFDALLYCPLEGKLNPLLTTLAFLDMAKKNGARLLTDSPVIGFTLKQNKIAEVITPQDTFTAGHIVNCAGPRAAFVADLASVKLPIRFHKGTALVSEPVEPTITGPLVGGGFFLDPPAVRPQRHIGFGTIQSNCGSILIAQSTEECKTDDRSVNMPSLSLVAARFLEHFPQLRELRIVRAWAAVTTYTEDDLPVFGKSERAENFFTVAGFKGAFSVAPAIGRITCEALSGKSQPEYEIFTPDRA